MNTESAEPAPSPPTALRNIDAVSAQDGDHGRRWLEGMWRGDPLADAVVAEGVRIGPARVMGLLRRIMVDGIETVTEAPYSLRALFGALDAAPEWLDLDRCDRAAAHLARHAADYGLVLGAASLVAGAQSHVAGKPLVFTGRYASQAAVRSIEVGAWLAGVTTPGGMRRDGAGFERTVRVRIIHAHVRARLLGLPAWDAPAWGVPIPQSYMAFTLAEFSSIALRAMHQLGVRYTEPELDDILHLWRYVGRLIGMDVDTLPVTAADHARTEALYALTSPGPDDGDRAFIAALTAFQAGELTTRLPALLSGHASSIMHGLQRAFVGDTAAARLAIPDTPLKHLPTIIGPVRAAGYAVHDHVVPNGKTRRTARGLRQRAQTLAHLKAEYAVTHELVDDVESR